MPSDGSSGSGAVDASGLRHGRQYPFALHTIGGKHPDGTPIALGPWTFEAPQVRRVVESMLSGRVLNACAGRTKLTHDDDVHRNDIDVDRDADTHHDVCSLDEHLAPESYDTIVFDPPFDSDQANEHYNGNTVGRGPSGGIWRARDALVEKAIESQEPVSDFEWRRDGEELRIDAVQEFDGTAWRASIEYREWSDGSPSVSFSKCQPQADHEHFRGWTAMATGRLSGPQNLPAWESLFTVFNAALHEFNREVRDVR